MLRSILSPSSIVAIIIVKHTKFTGHTGHYYCEVHLAHRGTLAIIIVTYTELTGIHWPLLMWGTLAHVACITSFSWCFLETNWLFCVDSHYTISRFLVFELIYVISLSLDICFESVSMQDTIISKCWILIHLTVCRIYGLHILDIWLFDSMQNTIISICWIYLL